MTTWTEQSAESVTYDIPPGSTTWDDGLTTWDLIGSVITTRWDANLNEWTDAADPDTTWTDA